MRKTAFDGLNPVGKPAFSKPNADPQRVYLLDLGKEQYTEYPDRLPPSASSVLRILARLNSRPGDPEQVCPSSELREVDGCVVVQCHYGPDAHEYWIVFSEDLQDLQDLCFLFDIDIEDGED